MIVIKINNGKWEFNGIPYCQLNETEALIFETRLTKGKLATKRPKKNKDNIVVKTVLFGLFTVYLLYKFSLIIESFN